MFAASALAASAQSRFDLNGDSEVNVGGVTKLVNIILGKEKNDSKSDAPTYSKYDLNRDGVVNVGDVTKVVNIVLIKEADDTDPAVMNGLCPDDHHPHRIDMGAAGVWACCNVGSTSPEGYGGYFAWGETQEKERYVEGTYSLYDIDANQYEDIGLDICGSNTYDVATLRWGATWQMPALEQVEALLETCHAKWTELNGVGGRTFTAPNGSAIFLPAAGSRYDTKLMHAGSQGSYWMGTRNTWWADCAWSLEFSNEYLDKSSGYNGYYGCSVRPVAAPSDAAVEAGLCPDRNHPHCIDLGAAGEWACCNVGAKLPMDGGGYFAWGEMEEKETYYWEDYQYFDKQTGDVEPLAWDISASQYDVAMDMMRGEWVMPSADQLKRLFEMCTFEWVALGNMEGGKFTAPNGNAIFLPAAGNKFGKTPDNVGHETYYWSSTYCATDVYKALGISFSTTLKHYNNQQFTRKDGMSVRAIRFEPLVIN
ncbi:MAG: hypothetical protein IKR63_04005 [Alloprevotella sp.]|nr:hypothetical protein [Alloprevotella sp.]